MRRFGLIFRFGLMFHTVLTCQVRHRSASHHLPHLTDPSKTALRSASLWFSQEATQPMNELYSADIDPADGEDASSLY